MLSVASTNVQTPGPLTSVNTEVSLDARKPKTHRPLCKRHPGVTPAGDAGGSIQ